MMSSRSVNLALLVVLSVTLLSGVAGLLVGTPDGRWVLWLHGIGGFALAALLAPKARVIARGYRRRGLTFATLVSAMFVGLVAATLLVGVAWSTTGFPGARVPALGSLTGLGVHIALAVLLVPFFVAHVLQRRPRARRVDFVSRRAAARYLAVASAGAALWAGSSAVTRLASLSGETRRFTGSRETGSFSGNGFPSTNWLSDPRPRLDPGTWELRVGGAVDREARWTLADLARQALVTQRATLDCTGGWYTVQEWSGVPMRALIEPAGAASGSHSILVRSATGYRRRYPLDELDRLLLATHVGGEVLSHGHGYPVRLVVPGRRGFEWVKWVVEIELSEEPAWLQSPLPLQ